MTSRRALLDVNVLIALHDENHLNHGVSVAWFRDNQDGGWATCPLSQNGFLRIITQPRYTQPVSFTQARSALSGTISETNHEFWPDSVSFIDAIDIDKAAQPKSGHLTDLYLLALAAAHGGRFVTLDRRISPSSLLGVPDDTLLVIGEPG